MQVNPQNDPNYKQALPENSDQQSVDIRWMLNYELDAATALYRGASAEQIVVGHTSPLEKAYHLTRYDYAANFVRGLHVLDFACGSGYGAHRLADAGAASVAGIDIDAAAVRYSALRYPAPNLSFRTIGTEDYLPSHTFDLAVSFETIEHVSDPEFFLANVAQSLKAEGRAFFSTPIRWTGTLASRPANPFHVREWSVEEFRELLSRYFAVVEPVLYQGGLPRSSSGIGVKQVARHLKRRFNGLLAESSLKLETALKPSETFDPTLWSRPSYMVVPCSSPR